MTPPEHDFEKLAHELAGALQSLLWQTEQMQGVFPDEDDTIKDALEAAYAALASADKTFGRNPRR
jgi:hypothetical protein